MDNMDNNEEFDNKALEEMIKRNPHFAEYFKLRNEFIEKYGSVLKKNQEPKKAA